jgi:hypothetical protein
MQFFQLELQLVLGKIVALEAVLLRIKVNQSDLLQEASG